MKTLHGLHLNASLFGIRLDHQLYIFCTIRPFDARSGVKSEEPSGIQTGVSSTLHIADIGYSRLRHTPLTVPSVTDPMLRCLSQKMPVSDDHQPRCPHADGGVKLSDTIQDPNNLRVFKYDQKEKG